MDPGYFIPAPGPSDIGPGSATKMKSLTHHQCETNLPNWVPLDFGYSPLSKVRAVAWTKIYGTPNLHPDPGFWPNLDPDPETWIRYAVNYERKN